MFKNKAQIASKTPRASGALDPTRIRDFAKDFALVMCTCVSVHDLLPLLRPPPPNENPGSAPDLYMVDKEMQ